jgi:hypothetical protein
MRWGHAFESAIVALVEREAGCKIIDRERLYERDYMTCHIDGKYESYPLGLHEGKTTSAYGFRDAWGEDGTDRVPGPYQIQCQHQMICTGAERVILSVLVFPKRVEEWEGMGWEVQNRGDKFWLFNPGEGGKYYEIPPIDWATQLAEMGFFHQYEITAHAELQALMIEGYREFWAHVLDATPPPPRRYDDIRALVREPVGTIIVTPEQERLLREYSDITKEISGSGNLAKRRDQIKTSVLDMARTMGYAIDDDSVDKWVFRSETGKKMAQYNGKVFR